MHLGHQFSISGCAKSVFREPENALETHQDCAAHPRSAASTARRISSSTVPSPVPSVFQSSYPVSALVAEKSTLPPVEPKEFGCELAGTDRTSLISTIWRGICDKAVERALSTARIVATRAGFLREIRRWVTASVGRRRGIGLCVSRCGVRRDNPH